MYLSNDFCDICNPFDKIVNILLINMFISVYTDFVPQYFKSYCKLLFISIIPKNTYFLEPILGNSVGNISNSFARYSLGRYYRSHQIVLSVY